MLLFEQCVGGRLLAPATSMTPDCLADEQCRGCTLQLITLEVCWWVGCQRKIFPWDPTFRMAEILLVDLLKPAKVLPKNLSQICTAELNGVECRGMAR